MTVVHAGVSGVAWRARLREPALRGAQLFAVSGLAFAQPLFDILGKNAEFFAAHGSTPGDILLFGFAVVFVPALVLLAVETLVGLVSGQAAFVLHLVFLAGLGAVFGVQALKRAGLGGTATLILGAVAIGVGLALAVWRVGAARWFLTVLAAAPPVFLAIFLFGTPVHTLVFPNAEARAASASVRHSTPVVFLLFDEFPTISLEDGNGDIDAGRFPNFARLAKSSLWFRNMTTVASSTTAAVPALLTGQYPKKGSLPVYQDHPNNLFTLLGKRYRMNVVETQTQLCPRRLCKRKQASEGKRLSSLYSDAKDVYLHLIAPPTLEERLPAIDESWADFGADTGQQLQGQASLPKVNLKTFYIGRLRDFNQWLTRLKPPSATPTLDYLHVLFPHGPWLYFPDGHVRAVADPRAPGRTAEQWWNESLAEQAWQRHLLQVGFTDKLLGRFIDRLQKTGLWDKALVIVTVDEGDSFRVNDNRRDPSQKNLGDIAFVPLFVKLPGQDQGRVVERHVSSVDIVPTIARQLGVKLHWHVDGRSVLSPGPGSPTVNVSGFTMQLAHAQALRRKANERKLALFGSGSWGAKLAATGPYWQLVGRPAGDLDVVGPVGPTATVDKFGSKLLRSLPKHSLLTPSPLGGKVSGLAPGATIAFALNGTIAAVSQVYRQPGGGLRFSVLPGAAAFRPGRNRAQAFVVSGPASSPELRELRVALAR
ncbi:MAG: sulfatase-like hydrolase/transferase [Gaiellaceae bacterium]